jgi:hypothetical protein
MNKFTTEQLEAWARLGADTTPGPWREENCGEGPVIAHGEAIGKTWRDYKVIAEGGREGSIICGNDADLLLMIDAHVLPDLARLVLEKDAEIARLQDRVRELHVLNQWESCNKDSGLESPIIETVQSPTVIADTTLPIGNTAFVKMTIKQDYGNGWVSLTTSTGQDHTMSHDDITVIVGELTQADFEWATNAARSFASKPMEDDTP